MTAACATPIMVKWPAKLKPAMIDTPISSLDLYPTVLKLVGIDSPERPGIDLTDTAAIAARKTIYGECFTHNYVNMDVPATSLRWRWVLEGRPEADRPWCERARCQGRALRRARRPDGGEEPSR